MSIRKSGLKELQLLIGPILPSLGPKWDLQFEIEIGAPVTGFLHRLSTMDFHSSSLIQKNSNLKRCCYCGLSIAGAKSREVGILSEVEVKRCREMPEENGIVIGGLQQLSLTFTKPVARLGMHYTM